MMKRETAAAQATCRKMHWNLNAKAMLCLLVMALSLAVHAFAGDAPEKKIRPELSAAMAAARSEIAQLVASEGGASSLSLVLVDRDSVLWAESFGYLDRTKNFRPDADTRYGLASGSKMFAAIATMILVDRGLVDLDVPFITYVPEFRMLEGEAYDRITTRMLLNHSSGFPGSDYRNGATFAPVQDHVLQILEGLADSRLKHYPGDMAMYCNDGFSLIELLVEKKSGMSYGDFVKQEILQPLGMKRSGLGTESFEEGSCAALLDDSGLPYPQEYINVLGTGGIYSTARELGSLAMMFLGKGKLGDTRILSENAIMEMGRNQSAWLAHNPFQLAGYGLGWDSVGEPWKEGAVMPLWRKNGGSVFYATQLDVAPDAGLALVMLAAGARFDMEDYSKEVFASLLAANGSMKALPAREIPPLPAVDPSLAARTEDIAGFYAGNLLTRIAPAPGSSVDAMAMSISHFERWIELLPDMAARKGGDWVSDSEPGTAYFTVELSGDTYLAKRDRLPRPLGGNVRILGRRLEPAGVPLSDAWKARLGRRWLIANDPFSAFLALGISPPGFSIREDSDLPGYIIASPWGSGEKALYPGTSDTRALMIGDYGSRDISDLVFKEVNGEEWVLWGTSLYRPMETIADIAPGSHNVKTATAGLGEWRRITRESNLEVKGATSWYLYDGSFTLLHSEVAGKSILRGWNGIAPSGSLLVMYGGESGEVRVNLSEK